MTFRRIFAIRSPLSEHIHHSHEFLPFLSRGESSLSLSVSRKPEENGKFFAIRSSSENETRYPPLMEERTVVTEELDRSLSRYFPLESNNDGPGLKASKASHTSVKPFLRFFSFGFNFPALYVHARTHKTRAKHSRSPLDSWGHKRGLFFSSRSIVRPTRFLLSFLFSFSSSSLLPFLPSLFFFFLFSLSLSSLLPSSSAQFERIMPAKQWHKGPAGLTRRAGSLEQQLPRILLQFLQYPSSKIRWNAALLAQLGQILLLVRANQFLAIFRISRRNFENFFSEREEEERNYLNFSLR